MKKEYKETEYSKKLRDPRWQKKRLEIMQRDDFHCQKCFDGDSTLNVHHTYYTSGNEPWGYPDKSLITLCETCHEEETITSRDAKSDIITILCQQGFLASHIKELATGLLHCRFWHLDRQISAIRWALSNFDLMDEIQDRYEQTLLDKSKPAVKSDGE